MDGKNQGRYIGVGIAIGAGIGAAIGAATDNIAVWVAIGIAVGVALGSGIGAQRERSSDDETADRDENQRQVGGITDGRGWTYRPVRLRFASS